jgi:Holliday junction resolvase
MAKGETLLVAKILKALRQEGAKAIKTHPAGVEVGTPDIIGCISGRMFALEVKDPQGRHPLSAIQRHRLEEWAAAGAIVGVVESIEEALSSLRGEAR